MNNFRRAFDWMTTFSRNNPEIVIILALLTMIVIGCLGVVAVQETNQRTTEAAIQELGFPIMPVTATTPNMRYRPVRYYDQEAKVACWVAITGISCLPESDTALHDEE